MRILITGANGMLGKSLFYKLTHDEKYKEHEVITTDYSSECDYSADLCDYESVKDLFSCEGPDIVYHLASRVGGIKYNIENKSDILESNLLNNSNLFDCAKNYGVKKLMFVGSTCMYPTGISRPMTEDDFMTGKLEETNDSYAISKIAGFYQCKSFNEQYGCNFITVCPTNMYGYNDHFDPDVGHFVPSLIYKIRQAKEHGKEVVLLGDGQPMRDWLFAGDCSDMMVYLMENYNDPKKMVMLSTRNYIKNVDLVRIVCKEMDYDFNKVLWDYDKMKNGMYSKISNPAYLEKLGYKIFHDSEWISLKRTIKWFMRHYIWNDSEQKYIKSEG